MIILNTSPLSGPIHYTDGTLDIHIFQDNVHGQEWTLKVTGFDGTETWFGHGFDTDWEALDALHEEIARCGAISFSRRPPIVYRDLQ